MSDDNKDVALDYIDLSLNDVEPSDGSFETVSPGEYVFEATAVKGGQSKAGNPKMVVSYKILDAITDADACKGEIGKEVVQSYSLKKDGEFGRRRVKALVLALGVELDERGGFDPSHMIGGTMIAEVKIEQYEEKNPLTGISTQKTSQKVMRERPDPDAASEESEDKAPEPEEKKPAPKRGRGRGGRRAATPSR